MNFNISRMKKNEILELNNMKALKQGGELLDYLSLGPLK